MAILIEQVAYKSMCGKADDRKGFFQVSFDNPMSCIGEPDALNSMLLRHVLAGVQASDAFSSLSLASDKASVCGLTLDAGAFVFPDNSCSVAVPQVLVAQRAGGGR